MKLSDTITRTVETPSCETKEGFPLVPGFEARPSYYPGVPVIEEEIVDENGDTLVDETALPLTSRVRENQRIRGCNYFVGGVRSDCATVEGGLHDATRQTLYRFYRRLHSLLWLAMGYQQCVPYSGQYNADWEGSNAFGITFEFVASQVSSTVVKIRFTPGVNPDPRNLVDSLDVKPASCIMPGDCVYAFVVDGTTKSIIDQAMIQDIEWLGTGDGGYHYANLTLTRPVFVTRNATSSVLVGWEKLPAPYRDVRLDGTDRCRYAKQTGHTCLSSFATIYPTASKAGAISGEWHCAKWRTTEFSSACNNTACPDYVQNTPTFHNDDLSFCLAARGVYIRHTIKPSEVPSGVTDLNYRWGRENWSGFSELIGMPTGWFVANLDQKTKDFIGAALLLWRTGSKVDCFDEFVTWADSGLTDDSFDLLVGWGQHPNIDPSGALASDMRLKSSPFDQQAYLRGPAWTCAYGQEEGDAYACGHDSGHTGNLAYIGRSGNSALQTIKPRCYTSKPFRVGTDSSVLDESTHVTTYATTQTELSGGGVALYSYKIQWQVPAFAEQVWTRRDVQHKTWPGGLDASGNTVLPKIHSISYPFANILKIEFQTAYDAALKPVDGFDDETIYYKTGGLVVCPDNAKQSRNPASCSVFGDRNIGLCAGDLIEIDGLPEVWLPCVGAEAFGGSTDTGAGTIDAAAAEIPDWLRANHGKRDVAYFDVSGSSGIRFRQWADENTDVPGLVGLDVTRITRNGISPARYASDGSATGFYPAKVKRWDATNGVKTLSTSEYKYDCTTGTFYIYPASGWATDQDTYLYTEQYVYDRNVGYSCEMVTALDRWLSGVCRGWINCGTIHNGSAAIGTKYIADGIESLYLEFWPPVPPSSGDWIWTLATCRRIACGSESYTTVFGIMDPPGGLRTYGCGATGANGDSLSIMTRQFDQVLKISVVGTPLARMTSAQIWRVLVNFELSNAIATTTQFSTSTTTSGTTTSGSLEPVEVESLTGFCFGLCYTDDGGATIIRVDAIAAAVGGSLSRYGTALRGTVDATEVIKYVLDNDAPTRQWCLMPAIRNAVEMVTDNSGHYHTDPEDGYSWWRVSGYGLWYDGAGISNTWLQLDPEHLDDTPVDFLQGARYLQERPPALA